MVPGLGGGSTAVFAVEALAERIVNGLRVVGIPTSEATAALARRLDVPLTNFAEHRRIDLTIDGADQVELGTHTPVKGLGGALLHEKMLASASNKIIGGDDETRLVDRLGGQPPDQATIRRIDSDSANVKQRWQELGSPEYPSAATVMDLHSVSRCEPKLQPFDFQDGVLGFDVIFPPLCVAAVTFRFAEGGCG